MSITSYKCPTSTVPLDADNSVVVRGFSSSMITELMDAHHAELETIFSAVNNIFEVATKNEGRDFALKAGEALFNFVKAAPYVVATLIAMAVQDEEVEPDAVLEAALNLPIGLQIEIVAAIAKLTVRDVASIKKIWGEVRHVGGVIATSQETQTAPRKPKANPKKRG